jgi:DNA polymerase-3 subunit delta
MSRQTFEVLLRALGKGELAPVYYLSGPEDTLKEEAAQTILDRALDPSWRDFNFEQRTIGQLEPEDLHTLLNTLPMMAGRRVVFLRELESLKKKTRARSVLLKYLERPSEELVLVLLEGGESEPDADLVRLAFSVHVMELEPERVVKWVLHRAARAGIEFAEGAAEHLAVACGHHLGTLGAELEKLAVTAGGPAVTVERVASLVGVCHGETIWDWRDAVMKRDTSRAVRLLGPVLDQSGMSGVKLVSTLGTTLAGVSLARAHHDRGARGGALERAVMEGLRRARPIGLPNWNDEVRQWSRWAAEWSADQVRAGLTAALRADQDLKSTRISDERGVVTDLVFNLTVSRAASRRDAATGRPSGRHALTSGA